MEPEEFTNLELLRNYELRPSRSGQLPSLQAVYAQGISAQQLGELFAEGPPQPPPRSVDVAQLHFMHRSCTNLMKPSEAGCHTVLHTATQLQSGSLLPEQLPPLEVWQDQHGAPSDAP
eukprot:TRINITY_DN1001_c0_g1_i18.p1 TRINITY_DN1001_c0_g1~~TRINITY_DN1001_c0_g1_i18.p1  ORF type:complete len:118 (+),score=29.41 TRINITY_DN1001_c0_g1_i18:121-474(+)